MVAGKKIQNSGRSKLRKTSVPNFVSSNRNGCTTLFDIVKRANHPNRKIHTLGFASRFSRSCLPGVFADDTHIMLDGL
jgi:hypothetical protein